MNYEINDTTSMILDALSVLLARHATSLHQHSNQFFAYNADLAAELDQGEYLKIAQVEGCSAVDAALVVERLAQAPWCLEVANSAIVAPGLGLHDLQGPVAIISGLRKPTRFLPVARHMIVEAGDELIVAPVDPDRVERVNNVLACPMGILTQLPEGKRLQESSVAELHRLQRVALACEAAGAMRAAIDTTVAYVRDRTVFGKPLAQYQAVEHRLAISHQQTAAVFNLALLAAHTGTEQDAATALTYGQQVIRSVVNDCHQFSGAIGLTLEYPLHLWTYRLKIIQGELGGLGVQSQALADILWPAATRAA